MESTANFGNATEQMQELNEKTLTHKTALGRRGGILMNMDTKNLSEALEFMNCNRKGSTAMNSEASDDESDVSEDEMTVE